MKNARLLFGVASLAVAAPLFVALPASAESLTPTGEAISAIDAVAPEVFEDISTSVEVDGDLASIVVDESSVAVQVGGGEASASITGQLGTTVEIGLPAGDAADDLDVTRGGVVIENDDSLTTIPVFKDDASLQVVSILGGPEAPESISYDVTVEGAASTQFNDDGSIYYLDAEGGFLAGVLAPWARDAEGKELTTHYEVEDGSLTQIVEHHGEGISYPIVADPYFGANLFSTVKHETGSYLNKGKYKLVKSAWGQANHLPTSHGIGVFLLNGWDEAVSRAPGMKNKTTIRQQYDCHVSGGYGNIAGAAWDLELGAPAINGNWFSRVHQHMCNWKNAAGDPR